MPQRLKSLELHGYKTFASKTIFEFPGPITAIVGPNGSGKSNIADSLRWVLGEQSFSLLRGRKTEDMIFSGSEQRPRAGMASASITFDNADGWLPIDFSDVTITRRAYRDGQNEYLLNGQKIRLKDIYELLAKSGLAERTYTIIGQGLVDAALALKPEERRRLFEEAAGIGLYRSRRQEALNRLETTRRNTERAEDIVAEIEPRIQSLERQARRVAEFTRIQGELKTLLKDWYGFHWFRSQQEMAHAREVMRSQETLVQQERQKQKECSENLISFRVKTQSIRSALNNLHGTSSQLHNQRESVNKDLAVLEERQHSISQQFLNLQNNKARIEEEISASEKRLESIELDMDGLQAEAEESLKKASEAQSSLKTRDQERSGIQQNLNQTRHSQMQKQTLMVRVKEQKKDVQSRIDSLGNSIHTAEQSLDEDQRILEAEQQNLNELEDKQQLIDGEVLAKQENLNALKQRFNEEEITRRKLLEQKSKYETELAKIGVQLDVLDQAEKSLSGYPEGAKILLEKIRNGNLKGIKSAVSNLIIVSPEFETAIAASLGDFMDGVVINDDDPESAISIVENGKKGRAALLPSASMKTSDHKTEIKDAAYVGRAIDLVKFPEEMKKILTILLQDVMIVKTRGDAHRLYSKITPGEKIVTLNGEVYLPNGTILAGFSAGASKLSRPRQKQEYEEQLKTIRLDIQSIEKDIHASDERIQTLSKNQADAAVEETKLRLELDVIHRERQKSSLNVDKLKRQIDWQHSQLTNNKLELEKARTLQKLSSEQIKTLESDLAEIENQIHDYQQGLSRLPMEELQNEVSHWRTNQAVATRALTDTTARRDEISRSISQNRLRLATLQEKFKELDQQKSNLEKDSVIAKEQEIVLSNKLEEIRVKIDPMEKDLLAAEQEYEALQAVESSVNQNLTITERHFAQVQLDYTRQNENIDNLKRKIEEDFGLVAFEYAEDVAGQTPLPFEGMVEQLPALPQLPTGLEESISRLKGQLRRIGAINPEAQAEYQEIKQRYEFMTTQIADLKKADEDLKKVILELDTLMKQGFNKTFNAVAAEFPGIFKRLFEGGSARLVLTDPDDPNDTGIEIEAKLPGRREQGLSLLSGGERSLTAAALIFALLKVAPTPFCVMDEVDAMLDESNVGRYRDMLKELSETIQFIVVTHNRNTVQAADVIYGVTMGRDSSSQVISLKLDEISDDMVKG